jgi:hypothetical protein
MRRAPTTAARAIRAIAGTVALLLIGAQLSSVGHHVLVAHYLCAAHGTLHHGDEPEIRGGERWQGEAVAPSSDGDHGAHDDCTFPVRTLPEAVTAAATGVIATTPLDAVTDFATAERFAHGSIPLLALAPKQGPPRS